MRCPKCHNVQGNVLECEECGIVFKKYFAVQRRKRQKEVHKATKVRSFVTVKGVVQVVLLVVVGVAAIYYFTYSAQDEPGKQQLAEAPAVVKTAPVQTKKKVISTPPPSQPVVNVQSTIEQAKQATVTIKTPWGSGSGFFVNKNYIVTNRHVVEFDQTKLANLKRQVKTNRQQINLERKNIQQIKRRLRQLAKGPERNYLIQVLRNRVDRLNKVFPQQKKMEERLTRLEKKTKPSDIKIVDVKGGTHVANYVLLSDSHDLALLSLFAAGDEKYIKRPPETEEMRAGDKVFAIGSPSGLSHTVTAGVFSGYRRYKNKVYLQTDAAINPGNSGGPLIDERGRARGVNTMILRNTEGIGFAISIDEVFDEFSSTLY